MMTFEEYVKEVRKEFSKYKHDEKEVAKFFSTQDVIDELKGEYELFNDDNEDIKAGSYPVSVASNLDMEF